MIYEFGIRVRVRADNEQDAYLTARELASAARDATPRRYRSYGEPALTPDDVIVSLDPSHSIVSFEGG